MKISIVVPIHNVAKNLLDPCLDSLKRQTLRSDTLEILLVDDCSTRQETIETVNQFANDHAHVSVVRHETNLGLNEARRSGTTASSGEFVVFVDGDDILTRDAAENLRISALATGSDIVVAPFWRWNPTDFGYSPMPITANRLPSDRLERIQAVLRGRHTFTMCGRAFRKSLLTDELFDMPERMLHEDLVTTVRLMFAADSVSAIDQAIYYYTANQASITHDFTERHVDGFFWAMNDWIVLAHQHGIFGQVEESIQEGAEKLLNTGVERCLFAGPSTDEARVSLLRNMHASYDELDIRRPAPSLPGTELMVQLTGGSDDYKVVENFQDMHRDDFLRRRAPSRMLASKFTIEPSDIALYTKDKIVFICQVDYQLRNAAKFARELRKRGHACMVLDNSKFAAGGKRQLAHDERTIFWRTERIVVDEPPYGADWLSTAKLVVVFNDFNNDFREALEYRHRLDLPTVCMVEGINDFLRVDFETPRHLPYRRCNSVFLAGDDDRAYFEDREVSVIGLPGVEALVDTVPRFPDRPVAALNVNFTYGVLEDRRDEFVAAACEAVATAGFDLTITQHPMDGGALDGLQVSAKTQYEIIDECSVFISRFATGILEALASGKPAIYFNPHGERVEKYQNSLGAFEIATTAEELNQALKRVKSDIAAGVDFRARATSFLQRHAGVLIDEKRAVDRFAESAIALCDEFADQRQTAAELVVDRLGVRGGALADGVVYGDLTREHHGQINEEEIIGRFFGPRFGLMLDVGANFGNSLDIYLGKGWIVHAFEPDPNNRKKLFESFPSQRRLVVNDAAISDVAGQRLPFFASDESTGISSLSAFTDAHRQVATVVTTTLDLYLDEWHIDHVDFLKIDIEGFDKFALDGFPWDRDRPEVVLAEFEDSKTVPLGYTVDDMADVLVELGYHVYISEWHPIIRYGIAHDWKSLQRYVPGMELAHTWGNVIGFRDAPDEVHLRELVKLSVKFANRPPKVVATTPPTARPEPAKPVGAKATPTKANVKTPAVADSPRPWYANAADNLRTKAPAIYKVLRTAFRGLGGSGGVLASPAARRGGQLIGWTLQAARRHLILSVLLLAAAVVPLLVLVTGDASENRGWAVGSLVGAVVVAIALAGAGILREAFRRLDNHRQRKLNQSTNMLKREIDAVRKEVNQARQTAQRALDEQTEPISAADLQPIRVAAEELRTTVEKNRETLSENVQTLRDQAELVDSLQAGIGAAGAAIEAVGSDIAGVRSTLDTDQRESESAKRFSNVANAGALRFHDRLLTPSDVARFQSNWAQRLGAELTIHRLRYLAHDICKSEDRCEGRLATTVQTAMLRCIALGSLPGRTIEILEIGTLFGIGAGAMYRAALRSEKEPFLTVVDPLAGYYGKGAVDPTTGVPVNRVTLERNFNSMGVPLADYRVLQGLSGDPDIHAECADRQYDFILIDGDHSLAGVSTDFELYGDLVKPGGFLVFDDYGTEDWPEIQRYVDENVRGRADWLWIGADWRTAILARR